MVYHTILDRCFLYEKKKISLKMILPDNPRESEVFMHYDTIKLLSLEHLKHQIESIDVMTESNQLIVHRRLIKKPINCPVCKSTHSKFNCYKVKKIKHSISTQTPCYIYLKQRRYCCLTCGRTFNEFNPFVESYRNIGHLTKHSILDYLKDFNHTFTDTAKRFNVSVQSVLDIFDQSIEAKRRQLPDVICIDEVFTSKMNKYKYACVLLDFKTSKIIDVIATRHKNYLINYFSRISITEKVSVKVFIMDMWDSYRDTVKLSFPKSLIAVDSFHIIRNLNEAMKSIRI